MALRIQYLMNTKEGAESHTVLVTDIPVLEFGTVPHRIETTVFRYLPVRVKVLLLLYKLIRQKGTCGDTNMRSLSNFDNLATCQKVSRIKVLLLLYNLI